MDWLTGEKVISVVTYLLPGFIAAWIFHGLTSHPRREPFERLVHAFIFNGIALGVTQIEKATLLWIPTCKWGIWSPEVGFCWSVFNAVVIGLVWTFFANNDLPHSWLREWKIWGCSLTKRTSYPTEWYSAFNQSALWIVLHLRDGRRLHGWPSQYPDSSKSGHFLMTECRWLDQENNELPLKHVETAIVPASRVVFVEQMASQPTENEEPALGDQKPSLGSNPSNESPKTTGTRKTVKGGKRRR